MLYVSMCVYGDILSKYVCAFLCSAVHMCFQYFEPITFINFNLLLILTSHALPFPCLTLWQISAIPDMPYRHVRKEPSRCQGKDTHQLQINIFTFRWPLSCITGSPFLSLSLSLLLHLPLILWIGGNPIRSVLDTDISFRRTFFVKVTLTLS